MTLKEFQRKVLFGMMSGIEEEFGFILNPFYKSNEEHIQSSFELAQDIYKKVFASFVSSYVMAEAKKLGIDENNSEEVIKAIKGGSIKPMPYYTNILEK